MTEAKPSHVSLKYHTPLPRARTALLVIVTSARCSAQITVNASGMYAVRRVESASPLRVFIIDPTHRARCELLPGAVVKRHGERRRRRPDESGCDLHLITARLCNRRARTQRDYRRRERRSRDYVFAIAHTE